MQHKDIVWGAVFSADDKRILTWSSDNSVRLWGTQTGKQIGPKHGNIKTMFRVLFSLLMKSAF